MKPDQLRTVPADDPIFDKNPAIGKLLGHTKPRSPQDLCLLCLKNMATQTKSHIFPRFFTRSMPRNLEKMRLRVVQVSKKGVELKSAQDTAKEDYILCPNCESRIGALERIVSLALPALQKTLQSPQAMLMAKSDSNYVMYFNIPGLEPALIHLFVYSILWRASISSRPQLAFLYLPVELREKLRLLLDTCLNTKRAPMREAMEHACQSGLPLEYRGLTYYGIVERASQKIFATNKEIGLVQEKGKSIYFLFVNEFVFMLGALPDVELQKLPGVDETVFFKAVSPADWYTLIAAHEANWLEAAALITGL